MDNLKKIEMCQEEWIRGAGNLEEWLRENCKTPLDAIAIMALVAMKFQQEYGLGAQAAIVGKDAFPVNPGDTKQAN